MERTFDVIGFAKEVLIYRGLIIMPKRRFHLVMSEAEYAAFRDKIELVSCRDLSKVVDTENEVPKTQESPSIIGHTSENLEGGVDGNIRPKKETVKTRVKKEV